MIIKKMIAAFLFGRGIKKFLNRNYKGAIACFQTVLSLNPEDRKKGFATYYLSRSYYYAGNTSKAMEEMPIAYEILREKTVNENTETNIDYFQTLANEYGKLLSALKMDELSLKIRKESKKIIKKARTERGQ